MIKNSLTLYAAGAALFAAYSAFTTAQARKTIQGPQNHAPVVKILSPKNNSYVNWDTQFAYEIQVSDKEDGDSKFDEINNKEVLLEVKYAADEKALSAELNKGNMPDAPGLALIRSNNCFNCHNFNSKLIGPSFYEINKHYPATAATTALLAKRIREGTTGVWGKVTMPTHPEFTQQQAEEIVQWIIYDCAKPDDDYYIGTQGTLRLKQPATSGGAFILTATYADHGLKNVEGSAHVKGQDIVVVRGK